MKNQFAKLLILGIVSFSVVMVGCKKSESVKYTFAFDSQEYEIDNGTLDFWGETTHSPLTYKFKILLSSYGIVYSPESSYTGTGNFIRLTVYSTDPLTLDDGTYTYDRYASKDSLTIDEAAFGINHDITIESGDGYYVITSGVFEVVKRGGFFDLSFELITQDNKSIIGKYTGLLENNISSKK